MTCLGNININNDFEMKRKQFCEIAPWAYRLSVVKCIVIRNVMDKLNNINFAKEKSAEHLGVGGDEHDGRVRRK